MVNTKEYKEKHYEVARKKQLEHLLEQQNEKEEYEMDVDIKKATGIIAAASIFLIML